MLFRSPENWIFTPLINIQGIGVTSLSFLLVFGAVAAGWGGIMTMQKKQRYADRGRFLILIGAILIVLYGLIWMLHEMRVI